MLSQAQSSLFDTLMYLAEEARPTFETFQTGDSRDDIARYGLCLILESAELVNSMPWKRWAKHPPDLAAAKTEFADFLCFLGSMVCLFDALGISPEELARAYVEKVRENRTRFEKYLTDKSTYVPS